MYHVNLSLQRCEEGAPRRAPWLKVNFQAFQLTHAPQNRLQKNLFERTNPEASSKANTSVSEAGGSAPWRIFPNGLTAFPRAFNLRASTGHTSGPAGVSHNLHVPGADRPELILYRCQGGEAARKGLRVLASAAIDFGTGFNPLLGALPEGVVIELAGSPQAFALAELLVGEIEPRRWAG